MPVVALRGYALTRGATFAQLSGGTEALGGGAFTRSYSNAILRGHFRLRATSIGRSFGSATSRRTRPDYLSLLQNLLPPGAAWTREADAELTDLLSGLALEFERVHDRAQDLLDESDPSKTVELLPDWERVAGLPDAYVAPTTIAGRQQALVAKLTFSGDQSRAAYIAAAQLLGYDVVINEFRPFDCLSTCVASLTQGLWVFAWQVVTPHGDDDALLEGVFRSRAQLHTSVLFQFT